MFACNDPTSSANGTNCLFYKRYNFTKEESRMSDRYMDVHIVIRVRSER